MAWTDKIFNYCERGLDPNLLAEPLNALSNLAFILAGVFIVKHYVHLRADHRQPVHLVLITLVFFIGIGSALFHTYANRWSVLADIIPITLFIYVYLYVSLTDLLTLRWWQAAIVLALFFVASGWLSGLKCTDGLFALDVAQTTSRPCLNGSIAYIPPLVAMIVIGGFLKLRNHPAANLLLVAAVAFTLSLTFRTIDMPLCPYTFFRGREVGTHFIWHLLNAFVLYSLLRAALRPKAVSHD